MSDLHSQAEAGLTTAIGGKLTRRQRSLVRACPELLRRLAHMSALPRRPGEVAEDVAADALPRVSRRLQQIAGTDRANAVDQFFDSNESALYPLCTAVALALQGTPTDLRSVAEGVQRQLSELPSDKTGLIWRFGPKTYYSRIGDSTEYILNVLTTHHGRRRRQQRRCVPASPTEVEALAQRWDEYREPPRPSLLFFDVALPQSLFLGRRS